MKTYIHYGSDRYDPSKFESVRNQNDFLPKPYGGLWASDVDAAYSWNDWCRQENFRISHLDKSFRFHLTEDANIFRVDSCEKLYQLPKRETPFNFNWYLIDFEAALASGIDAIEICISECRALYWELYGWDCDSILIMNKDVIVAY